MIVKSKSLLESNVSRKMGSLHSTGRLAVAVSLTLALLQAGTKYQPLHHGRLVMGITPAELKWLRENEIDFELLDGGESEA